MNSILELKDVSYVYNPRTPNAVTALDHVSLSIRRGAVTGLIGHTGSGKSTLVRLLNGLEKPTSGNVFLDGEDIWSKPKEIGKVRFRVGLVMQYPEYQLFEETVAKDIAFGPKNMKLPDDEIAERVRVFSEMVGLCADELEKSPFELSGGQKRRAAIAGIMAMKPEVLILDEPAAGLDPEGRRVIFDAIENYRRQENASVVIVSHSMEDMAERCDDILVMAHAAVVLQGTKDEIFSSPDKLVEAGLDVPQITKIAMLLSQKGIDFGKPVYRVCDAADILEALIPKRGDRT